MAAKLRSISDRIPWSLLCKAAAFGASWLLLPFWAFVAVALGLYFVPFFEPRRFFLPFVLTLYFAAVLPAGTAAAILLAVLCYLILGVKDLLLVRRTPAYAALVVLLFFLALLRFFGASAAHGGASIVLWALLPAAMFFFLLHDLLRYAVPDALIPRSVLAAGVAALLAWQIAAAVALLPANAFFQSAIALIAGALLLEFALDDAQGTLTRRGALVRFSIFFALQALLLFVIPWGI